ncbi:MAG: hypothetical protein LBS10_09240 [Gracilibacteraceae bacterium]|nr:hypothetical protein [Gracilibacteraceae bacterium]
MRIGKSLDKNEFYRLLRRGDFAAITDIFDQNPLAVRRLLTRLSYAPADDLHRNGILCWRELSARRATARPDFFREVIRRHIWGMNDEGGNIDWSAPEIIGAIVAGAPELYAEFIPIMRMAAEAEPLLHPSLQAALTMLSRDQP